MDRPRPLLVNRARPPSSEGRSAEAGAVSPTSYLRRQFTLPPGQVVGARLYATAHGVYVPYLNGARVGDHELAPGWTDYNDRVMYQTYDVTESLREGDNVVGAVLADGWWSGFVGFDRRRPGAHWGSGPEFWARLVVDFDDGGTFVLATDERWQHSHGCIVYSDALVGEWVDARRDAGAWEGQGFDGGSWVSVVGRQDDGATLVPMVDEPMRVMEIIPAVSVQRAPSGAWLYDFGQNLVGRVTLDLGTMEAGQIARLRFGEMLDGNELYVENLRSAEATDRYTSRGGASNPFAPTFAMHGFRFMELSGVDAPPEPSSVSADVVRNDIAWAGEVVTSSSDVNALLSNIRWGQRSNFVAVPTDCPQRDERLGWTADAQVFLPTAALTADVASFFTRWLRDVRFAQSPQGSFPDYAPVVGETFIDGAPGWGDGGVIIPWHLYRTYGDARLLEQSFESMHRWVDFIASNNSDLVWRNRAGNQYGDWLQVDAHTPRDLLATAFFAHSASIVAAAADALGRKQDALHYQELAASIRLKFVKEFVGHDGTLAGNTQTGYLLALAFDLVPQGRRDELAGHLIRAIADHDGLLTTGFIGVSLLCPVPSEVGRSDVAYSLLETDRYPSWLYSVRQGATTIWERWDGWTAERGFQAPEMNSFNHYSLGSVGEWIYRYCAGIDQEPDSVAYRTLRLAPHPGGTLSEVKAYHETIRGLVMSHWNRVGATEVDFTFAVPPGTTANVSLPSCDGRLRDGSLVNCQGRGEHFSDGRLLFTIGSGKHHFRTTVGH